MEDIIVGKYRRRGRYKQSFALDCLQLGVQPTAAERLRHDQRSTNSQSSSRIIRPIHVRDGDCTADHIGRCGV